MPLVILDNVQYVLFQIGGNIFIIRPRTLSAAFHTN